MNLLDVIRGNRPAPTDTRTRSDIPVTFDEWLSYAGNLYPLTGVQFTQNGTPQQSIENSFESYVSAIGNRNGTVAAAVAARALILSQAHFKFRRLSDGPPGALFGTQALAPLEKFDMPWTRPRILMRAEQHVSYGGAAYFHKPPGGRIRLLNPDCVRLVISSDMDPDTPANQLDGELVAYLYYPDPTRKDGGQVLAPTDVVQWAPEPHPVNPWIGQSWITSVMAEVLGDEQLTEHQAAFYANAATPNMVITLPATDEQAAVDRFMARHIEANVGPGKTGKSMLLTDGADAKVVGSQLAQLELKDTQGGHESRIASRSRVPATVLGIREGLAGSALNAGNYSSARRMWADGWYSPVVDGLCDALSAFIEVPAGAELTVDTSRVMFLQEDRKDEADIGAARASTIRTYIEAGFTAESARDAVQAGDLTRLVHTGMVSVQLQDPTAATPDAAPVVPDVPAPV